MEMKGYNQHGDVKSYTSFYSVFPVIQTHQGSLCVFYARAFSRWHDICGPRATRAHGAPPTRAGSKPRRSSPRLPAGFFLPSTLQSLLPELWGRGHPWLQTSFDHFLHSRETNSLSNCPSPILTLMASHYYYTQFQHSAHGHSCKPSLAIREVQITGMVPSSVVNVILFPLSPRTP